MIRFRSRLVMIMIYLLPTGYFSVQQLIPIGRSNCLLAEKLEGCVNIILDHP